LTDKGQLQAIKTGKHIKRHLPAIDLIICSPYGRAYETAKSIAGQIDYPITKIRRNELFVERTFGILEGTSVLDFYVDHDYKDIDQVEGAESIKDLDSRAAEALRYVNSLKNYDNVLIVSHGAFGRAFRRAVKGLPHTHEYETYLPIANAEIVELI
jgi:broad specificity phosphatase PhoE